MGRAVGSGWTVMLGAAVLLQACARGDDPEAHGGARQAPKHSTPAVATDADLVSAVSPAGAVGPVTLKFRVAAPPRVGQPAHVELALIQDPGQEITHMLVSLSPGEGLEVTSQRSIEFNLPETGATQRMAVDVQPEQAGLVSLNATVLVDGANTSLTRSFSVPLIAVP